MDENYDYYVPERSRFVTIVGVIFIVLAGISMLGIFAQAVFFSFMQSNPEISQGIQEQIDSGTMSSYAEFMYTHRVTFMVISFLIAIVELVASIGLLMRQNWARVMFIVLMSIFIVRSVFTIGMQFFTTPQLPATTSESAAQFMSSFMMFIRIFSFLFMLGLCVLYGWIISKLLSEKIRREFIPQTQSEND